MPCRWRNQSELLQDAQLVGQSPVFDDLAVFGAGEDDPLYHDRPAGGRVTQEQSLVRAAHRPMRLKLIALSDFILDSTVKIGEGGAELHDQQL